jgi:hypothetical protein
LTHRYAAVLCDRKCHLHTIISQSSDDEEREEKVFPEKVNSSSRSTLLTPV